MSVILLRLEGPMQSWGINSRFTLRTTQREPSKSAIIGLIASALGRSRDSPIQDLKNLAIGIRIDRPGDIMYDYQTAQNVAKATSGTRTVTSKRYFIADACFLVGLEGENIMLLKEILKSIQEPNWPLFLGRKAFLPSSPIFLTNKVYNEPLETILRSFRWLGRENDQIPERLQIVVPADKNGGEPRLDSPLSFISRKFAQRYIRTYWIDSTTISEEEA